MLRATECVDEFLVAQPFVQLPLLTPEQIQVSRQIQRFFVGDLEAPVMSGSTSIFPGVEKHLLRAQIQRITAATQVHGSLVSPVTLTGEVYLDCTKRLFSVARNRRRRGGRRRECSNNRS